MHILRVADLRVLQIEDFNHFCLHLWCQLQHSPKYGFTWMICFTEIETHQWFFFFQSWCCWGFCGYFWHYMSMPTSKRHSRAIQKASKTYIFTELNLSAYWPFETWETSHCICWGEIICCQLRDNCLENPCDVPNQPLIARFEVAIKIDEQNKDVHSRTCEVTAKSMRLQIWRSYFGDCLTYHQTHRQKWQNSSLCKNEGSITFRICYFILTSHIWGEV